jgi:hypothetical protein
MIKGNTSMFNRLDYYTLKDNQYICNKCNHSLANNFEVHILSCNGTGPRRKIKPVYTEELKQKYLIQNNKWYCIKCELEIKSSRQKHANSCDGRGKRRDFDLNKVTNQIKEGQLCSFGCGKPAKHYFKSSMNFGCSSNVNACEAKRQKNSQAKKGINPFEGKEHPKGAIGHIPWNKGLTKKDDNRIENASQKAQASLITYYQINGSRQHTPEAKQKISNDMKARYASGWETVCGRAKKYDYLSPIAGKIKVDGTWELTTAQILDKIGIQWVRNKKRFDYIHLNGNEATYLPDFYLPGIDTYLEIKGFQTELDLKKWAEFKPKLYVLKKPIIMQFRKWLKEDAILSETEFLNYLNQEVIKINC